MILACQLADEFTGHYQGLLVGQAYLFSCLDGMDGGRQTGKAHHGSEHHVDGRGLHYLVNSLCAGIHFDVGLVGKERLQCGIVCLVGNHHGSGMELPGLCRQFVHAVVGGEAVYLIQVGMFFYHFQSLGTYRPRRTEDAYLLSLLHLYVLLLLSFGLTEINLLSILQGVAW